MTELLPEPCELRRRCVALALLDEILAPEWEDRYYSFDPAWAKNEAMASMRNGEGDGWFIGFNEGGVFLKGFAHESAMSPFREDPPVLWPGIYDGVPKELLGFLNEPAFVPDEVTFCWWWDARHPGWRTGVTRRPRGADPDGAKELLRLVTGDARAYKKHAREIFEAEVPLASIEKIYAHEALTEELVTSVNERAETDAIVSSARKYGYGTPSS